MGKLIIRIDDVAPAFPWSRFTAIEQKLLEKGIRPIVGVIPDCRDESLDFEEPRTDFWDKIRFWKEHGWSIAQHGYQHVYDNQAPTFLGGRRKSEFAGHDLAKQTDRLSRGKEIMETEGVWQGIFMAPNHAFDHITLRALQSKGFEIVTDGWGMYPYRTAGISLVPQLISTDRTLGFGVYTCCLHIGSMSEASIEEFSHSLDELTCVSLEDALEISPPSILVAAALRGSTKISLGLMRTARRYRSRL